MAPAKCALFVACGLAACAPKQTAVVENVANESGPAASAPAAPSTTMPAPGSPTSAQLQPCTSAAPFTVRVANKSTTPIDVCGAFEKALAKAVQTVTFGPPGTFQVDVTLMDVQVRGGPNNRFLSCKVSIGLNANGQRLAQANGGASVAAPLRFATRDCTEAVIDNLLTKVAQGMQQHVASTTAGTTAGSGATQPSAGSASTGPTP